MSGIFDTGMNVLTNAFRAVTNHHIDDIVEKSAPARVEPFTMIETSLLSYENTKPILQMIVNHYACYYTMAFALQTDVGLKATRILDSLATERNVRTSVFTNASLFGESFEHGLPCGEAFGEEKKERGARRSSLARDNHKIITENSNLSVGKVFEVTMEDGDDKVTVPIAVRLHTLPVESSALTTILAYGSEERGVIPRIRMVYDGEKDFVHDFLLNKDLIEENKRLRKGDAAAAFKAISSRAKKNTWAGLLSGNPSINKASAITVMSSESLKAFEAQVGAKLSRGGRARKALFDNTSCMLIAVVDRKWERVTLYYRSIEEPQSFDMDDLKDHNKEGVNLDKVIGELVKGNPPTF